jgi:hypothetical protein
MNMTSDEFVELLERLMPSSNSMKAFGLSEEEMRDVQASFRAIPRRSPKVLNDAGEIGRLLSRFDCSSLEIGLIRFDDVINRDARGWRFGTCEADPLFVVGSGGAVVMHDHSIPQAGAAVCAISGDRFLDALAEFALVRSERSEWKGRANEASARCCLASGEPASLPFYRALCAFLD